MLFACLHCKAELVAEVADRSLVRCPTCEFLCALAPAGRPEIPTFAEEGSLAAVEARHATDGNGVPDTTVIGDTTESFGNLPVPPGKILYVELVESPEGGDGVGTKYGFKKGRMVFGRSDADIIVHDDQVSRKHAMIEAISRENIYLKDLASTNGTYLNGQSILMKKLASGDEIRVGTTVMRFVAQDE